MSLLLRELHTCELSPELHTAAVKRFERDPAIHCHLGPSPAHLSELAAAHERQPLLHGLESHWCSADDTAGEESQCPLSEKIAAIASQHPDSVVWIDDARYFMAPLFPLESRVWPRFQKIMTRLQALSGTHDVVFANDTILLPLENQSGSYGIPSASRSRLASYRTCFAGRTSTQSGTRNAAAVCQSETKESIRALVAVAAQKVGC